MIATIYSLIRLLLEVVVIVAVAGILIAMNLEYAVAEWKRLRLSALLRLIRIGVGRRISTALSWLPSDQERNRFAGRARVPSPADFAPEGIQKR